MLHKLAKIARRPIFSAPRDRLLSIRLQGASDTTFGTARGREQRGQLPEERTADELNKRTRGEGTGARRFLEVPTT